MVRESPMQFSFTAGEFSPLLDGHINLASYPNSLSKLENMIILKQGAVTRRGGSKFISEVKYSNKKTTLVPFDFGGSGGVFQIELGDKYIRFIKDNEYVMSGGSIYEVVSPYASDDLIDDDGLKKFQTLQVGDVVYIAHGEYAPRALVRFSANNWTLSEVSFNDGAYLPENLTTTTLSLSATTGSVTVTASSVNGINSDNGFISTDVGRLIRWRDGANNWTWLKITAFISSTQVTADIKGDNPSSSAADTRWRLSIWSETTGYPRVISLIQDRIFLGWSLTYSDRWALTITGGYTGDELRFSPSDKDGLVTADASISGTLKSKEVNEICWANQDDKGLIVGTSGADWLISSTSSSAVLTPDSVKVNQISSTGSAYMQSLTAEVNTLFIQRSRRRLFDVVYNFNIDRLKPEDRSLFFGHLTSSGIVDITLQKEPLNTIWVICSDGSLFGITYYPDHKIYGAHRHILGGKDVKVKAISVAPDKNYDSDQLTVIVERTINGYTVQYLEYLTQTFDGTLDKKYAFHVDSGIVYDGVSTNTVSGLDHLEGETVKLLIDGKSHPDLVVSGGSVTLLNSKEGSYINVGLACPWYIKTQRVEAGSRDGVSQGKNKKIQGVIVRLLNSLGLSFSPDGIDYTPLDFEQAQSYNEDISLYTGDTPLTTGGFHYDTDGYIYVGDEGVFPITILAIMPQVITSDRG